MFKIDVYNVTLEYKAQGVTTNYNRHKITKSQDTATDITSVQSCVSPNTYIDQRHRHQLWHKPGFPILYSISQH